MTLNDKLQHARQFFGTHIWTPNAEAPRGARAALYRASRLLYATARAFREKELPVRAAALTYYSVLSIVPFLAFAFSLLKGFGVYKKLMANNIDPFLQTTFAGNETMLRAISQMLAFVETTSVSGLSIVGLIFLVYTSVSMLSTVETALNDIWEARSPRPVIRKVTDYTTLMVVGPLLIVAAISFSAAAQSSSFVAYLHRSLLLGDLVDFLLGLTSLLLGCVALVALYVIMPNTRTRLVSALLGGVAAGVAWQLMLLVHVKFQVGVARFNVLYSGFAAFPIFLVWLYASWNIVLVGAQIAASHQFAQRLHQNVRARHVDQELRETLAVALAAAVSRRFLEGQPPATGLALAGALDLPPPAIEPVLDALVRAGVLVRVVHGDELGYDPGRDIDAVRMVDIEDAVRMDPAAAPMKGTLERTIGPSLSALLHARHTLSPADTGSLTLRQLAAQCTVRVDASAPGPRRPRIVALLDGKQPGVPA